MIIIFYIHIKITYFCRRIANELRGKISEDKNNIACKNQWNSLIKKYKSFFQYRTGEGTGEEATVEDPNDWEFYETIHAYASQKDNFHPPYLIDSGDGILNMKESLLPHSPANKRNVDLDSPTTSKSRSNIQNIERDIKKRDKKISKKISSLLSVFGQMVQTDYPHIDASVLFVSSESDSD